MVLISVSCEIWDSNGFWALSGALLGFLFSVLLSFCQKKCAIHKLKKRLKLEINDSIVLGVEKAIKNKNYNSIEFKSPIWDFMAQSSLLLDVSEKLYIWIVNIYVAIKDFARNEIAGNCSVEKRTELFKALNDNPIDKNWKKKCIFNFKI